MSEEGRRKDDGLMRKTIYGLVATIFIGVIGHFMTIGQVQTRTEEAHNRIDQLNLDFSHKLDQLFVATNTNRRLLDDHKEEFYEVKIMVSDTKTEARAITKTLDQLGVKVDESIKNQNQIIPIVNQAQDFMASGKH